MQELFDRKDPDSFRCVPRQPLVTDHDAMFQRQFFMECMNPPEHLRRDMLCALHLNRDVIANHKIDLKLGLRSPKHQTFVATLVIEIRFELEKNQMFKRAAIFGRVGCKVSPS